MHSGLAPRTCQSRFWKQPICVPFGKYIHFTQADPTGSNDRSPHVIPHLILTAGIAWNNQEFYKFIYTIVLCWKGVGINQAELFKYQGSKKHYHQNHYSSISVPFHNKRINSSIKIQQYRLISPSSHGSSLNVVNIIFYFVSPFSILVSSTSSTSYYKLFNHSPLSSQIRNEQHKLMNKGHNKNRIFWYFINIFSFQKNKKIDIMHLNLWSLETALQTIIENLVLTWLTISW